MVQEITCIEQLVDLVVDGCEDWEPYGEVNMKSNGGDLVLFNYKPEAQFAYRWNYFERIARGLIINRKTGEIVARSFDKFFNWGDFEAPSAAINDATEKVDGSLGIFYRDNGFKIATRGSFESDQAKWATKFLNDNHDLSDVNYETTLLFEIIYPENRVVVDYGDRKALVLIGARNRFTGLRAPMKEMGYWADLLGMPTAKVYNFEKVDDILEMAKKIDGSEEGWVVEFTDGSLWKFKGDRYKELHKLISGLSFKNALIVYHEQRVDQIRRDIPDEFLGEFDKWIELIDERWNQIEDRIAAAYDQKPEGDQKTFALWVTENHKDLAAYLFSKHKGRCYRETMYRNGFEDLRLQFREQEQAELT